MASAAALAACDPRVGPSLGGSWTAPTREELSKLPTDVLQDLWQSVNAELAHRNHLPRGCYVGCEVLPSQIDYAGPAPPSKGRGTDAQASKGRGRSRRQS